MLTIRIEEAQHEKTSGNDDSCGVVVAALLVSTVAFTVDQSRDIVLVKTFGKTPTFTTRRKKTNDAGLKFKWPMPVQEQVRYESRLMSSRTR